MRSSCSICLSEISAKCASQTLACSHVFHRECVANWLCRESSCPLCRAEASYPLSMETMTDLVKTHRWHVPSHVFVRLRSVLGIKDTMRLFSKKMHDMYVACDLSFNPSMTLETMRWEHYAVSELLEVEL